MLSSDSHYAAGARTTDTNEDTIDGDRSKNGEDVSSNHTRSLYALPWSEALARVLVCIRSRDAGVWCRGKHFGDGQHTSRLHSRNSSTRNIYTQAFTSIDGSGGAEPWVKCFALRFMRFFLIFRCSACGTANMLRFCHPWFNMDFCAQGCPSPCYR